MLTKQDIYEMALHQSAIDLSCEPEDFLKTENVVTLSKKQENCRSYLELPFFCNLVTYGTNVVASVDKAIFNTVNDYIHSYKLEHCFQTPQMYVLNRKLEKHRMQVCFMAEYFLPDPQRLAPQPCAYSMQSLKQADFEALYLPQWGNALCEDRKNLDVLGVGAYDKGRLVGLAACSADCESMWQIGIDVLPGYRRQGIASALTGKLAYEILERGKAPFYCAAWSNIKSVGNAIKSGFYPAWAEMTAKPFEKVLELNRLK